MSKRTDRYQLRTQDIKKGPARVMRLQQVHGIYSYFRNCFNASCSRSGMGSPIRATFSTMEVPRWTSRTRWWQSVTHWKDQYCECVRDKSLYAFERDILKRSYMFFYSFQTKSRPTTYPLYQNIHLPYHNMLQ